MNTIKSDFARLTKAQEEQLLKIIPIKSNIGNEYFPCSVLLINGERINCVYMANINQYVGTTINNIERDESDIYLKISDIIKIEESRYRLPPKISQMIYKGGESVMGSTIFTLEFTDKSEQLYECGNLFDFIPLPVGKTMNDIANVRLHSVPIRTKSMQGLDYKICYFSQG